jgi:hypothetical protein
LANDQCFETLPVVPQQQAHKRLVYLLHQNLKQSLEHDYNTSTPAASKVAATLLERDLKYMFKTLGSTKFQTIKIKKAGIPHHKATKHRNTQDVNVIAELFPLPARLRLFLAQFDMLLQSVPITHL